MTIKELNLLGCLLVDIYNEDTDKSYHGLVRDMPEWCLNSIVDGVHRGIFGEDYYIQVI